MGNGGRMGLRCPCIKNILRTDFDVLNNHIIIILYII
jgi:hypothetical protein